MRKIKKINGFLVVKFNDKERRENPSLGLYGVIDAELYTGDIDFDRSEMEYDDAETLEIAVEQARSLDAEEDYSEESPVYTVTVETAEEISEEEVDPRALLRVQEEQLKTQIKSKHYPDIDPWTAAHELNGYKAALRDLGLMDEDDADVAPDHFAPGMMEQPLPRSSEELLAHICDELCKYRIPWRTQEELDVICEKCKVGKWAADPPTLTPQEVRELRNLLGLLKEVNDFVSGGDTPDIESPRDAEQDTFKNAPPGIQNDRNTKKVYALGLMLNEDCPENDCIIYRNIFKMALELDETIGKVGEHAARVLRKKLIEHIKELREMYDENFAIQQFREGVQK